MLLKDRSINKYVQNSPLKWSINHGTYALPDHLYIWPWYTSCTLINLIQESPKPCHKKIRIKIIYKNDKCSIYDITHSYQLYHYEYFLEARPLLRRKQQASLHPNYFSAGLLRPIF